MRLLFSVERRLRHPWPPWPPMSDKALHVEGQQGRQHSHDGLVQDPWDHHCLRGPMVAEPSWFLFLDILGISGCPYVDHQDGGKRWYLIGCLLCIVEG